MTAAITDSQIKVSPRRFGAGPIVLIISNQSSDAQAVTFETGGGEAGIRQTTSAINPAGTAQLQIDVRQGTYELSVEDRRIRPAAVRVGSSGRPRRTSCCSRRAPLRTAGRHATAHRGALASAA